MNIYIRSTAAISPQQSFGNTSFPAEAVEYVGNRLKCVEPDYSKIIDPKLIRRMSRIIKMGVAAASSCLQDAAVSMPDAIIMGTAYGCLEDTEIFLRKIVENKEEMLTPTAFIQSTHNTVGAQVALMLKCHQYNNTYVNRGFSFESALLDAMMMLEEKKISNILAGAVDEIIPASHTILSRMGLYKQKPVSNLNLYTSTSTGTIAGEGATFFVLANEPGHGAGIQLNGIKTFYKPADISVIEKNIYSFLEEHNIPINEIDLIITGRNGDKKGDEIYQQLNHSVFNKKLLAHYKHLCGEYPTATAFALWLAARIIKNQTIPSWVADTRPSSIKKVLLYNHYQNIHHSLFLLSAC